MSTAPDERPSNTVDLNVRAFDNLAYIRQTMQRSAEFTAVPGWGLVGMGLIALAGSIVACYSGIWWIFVWTGIAVLACTLGAVTLALKCRREYGTILAGPAQRFALNLAPPIAAGAVLTDVFDREGLYFMLPGMWLLLYGVGVLAAGSHSVRIVPLMGITFIVFGAGVMLFGYRAHEVFLWGPITLADGFLAAGFGLIHIAFGLMVAWRYGG